jgi:hypothetical protein
MPRPGGVRRLRWWCQRWPPENRSRSLVHLSVCHSRDVWSINFSSSDSALLLAGSPCESGFI